ncbi:MAG TPA: type II secretion system secretin GspD [Quisquiliibacterium sp.]|nr:type II secretion system secretin GspD [Quisquiliibacterium sp.]
MREPVAFLALLALVASLLAGVGTAPAHAQSKKPARPQSAEASSADSITLNFRDAEIDAVVGAFGHLLNRSFLIDPRVRGKLTLETPSPVTRQKAYELLQASLRVQGFAVVESGQLSRVVPEADAKLQSGPVSAGGGTERGGDQVVTQIFRLNYESASNLVPVLRPLITANNTITAYPSNNALVVTDYAANLQRLARIIATLDTPSTSDVEVLAVRHAVASDVATTVSRMLDDTGRAAQGAQVDPGQRVTVMADPRMNSVMIRTPSRAKMNLAKSLVVRLDQPSEQQGNIHVVYLRNAEAVRLAQVLRGVLSGDASGGGAGAGGAVGATGAMGGLSGTGATGAGLSGGALGSSALGTGSQAGQTGALGGTAQATTPLQGSGQGQQGATSFQAGGAIIAADPSTNSLIITAPPPIYRNLRAVIERLDARRAQVFIESLIVEITAEKAAELGVQWQFLNGLEGTDGSRAFGGTNLTPRGAGTNILDVAVNPLSAAGGLNLGVVKGAITYNGTTILNLGLLARALETGSNANILATPNLLTLDNEEARIIIGQNVPFLTGQFTSTGTAGGSVNPFQTIERRDVGTTLRVRPQISESGSVRMQIFQETSNVASQTAQGLITNRRAIESNVLVDDGQIVVLGGLIEDRVEGGDQKVPLLGDLPFMGQLFRYDNRKRTKTNLLVFLRPIVLRDADAANSVTTSRYDYVRQLQGDSRLPNHWALPEFPPKDLPSMPPLPGKAAQGEGRGEAPPGLIPPSVDVLRAAPPPPLNGRAVPPPPGNAAGVSGNPSQPPAAPQGD